MTGFVAILRGGGDNGRTVLLRGDMDALPMPEETGLDFASQVPNAMHACGHESHCSMLVGAARALSARKDKLPGTVVFMFQPGEEGHHGARFMIEDGLLGVARPASAFALNITLKGAGGHAAMPLDCLDPVPVSAEIITALSVFVARQIPATDPAVLSITKIEAGSAYNIVPGEAKMIGTLRTLSPKTREKARAGLTRIVEHVAQAHGLAAEVRIDEGYPVTMCDARAVALIEQVSDSLEEGQWPPMPAPIMGGEDFSYVLREVPGALAILGVAPDGTDPSKNPPLHNTKMTIEESVMAKGIAMHCAYAERFLENGFG